jgi:small subunit ribosomal protein S17
MPTMPTTANQTERKLTATRIGVVTSDKRDKTRTVSVDYQQRHPKYGKFLHRSAKYHVHDENNDSKIGDRVEIARCRPLSKTKMFRLVRVVESAPEQVTHRSEVEVEEIADNQTPQTTESEVQETAEDPQD